MAEWARITNDTIKEVIKGFAHDAELSLKLLDHLDPRTPEEKERDERNYRRREARLAAIEAAKTPTHRLREQQDRCTHDFIHTRCRKCQKHVSVAFARGYGEGYERGRDDGYQSAMEEL